MKIAVLVNEGPYQHQAADSAYLFCAAALAKMVHGPTSEELAMVLADLGNQHLRLKHLDEAFQFFAEAARLENGTVSGTVGGEVNGDNDLRVKL